MFGLGMGELVVILVIVVVIFGAGRVKNIMGEVGAGVKAFKNGVAEGEAKAAKKPAKKSAPKKK